MNITKTKTRILSLVMAAAMLVCILPVSASAYTYNRDFRINKEEGLLLKYQGAGGDVVIPDGVTSIGSCAFEDRTDVTSVVIPDGVTSIGGAAFRGCTGLTSIVIPGSVETIHYNAFEGCTSLTSIVIPGSVLSIYPDAFKNCTGLTDVAIAEGVNSISSYAFRGCTNLTSVVVPNGTDVYLDAFDSWTTVIYASDTGADEPEQSDAKTEPETPEIPEPVETKPETPVQKFSDVAPTAWYFEAVNAMAETGLLKGDGNGNFNPESPITYGEFATLLCRIYGLPVEEHKAHRSATWGKDCDGSCSWASAALYTTRRLRYTAIGNISFLTTWDCFDANELMNRGETMNYLMDAYFRMHPELGAATGTIFMANREKNGNMEYAVEKFEYDYTFEHDGQIWTTPMPGNRIAGVADENIYDLPNKAATCADDHNWNPYNIAAGYALGLVHGDENGYFNPRNTLTRAEMCQLMYNMGFTAPGCIKYFAV